MRSIHAYHMVKNRYPADSGGNKAPQRSGKGSLQMDGFENMSVTMKVVGAAGAGAFAAWLLEGDYSFKGFCRLLAAMIIAGFMAIAAVSLLPFLNEAGESAKIGIAGVVGGFSADIFKRWTKADFKFDAGPLHMESEGKDEKEKLP